MAVGIVLWSRYGGGTTDGLALPEMQFMLGDFELALSCFELALRCLEFGGSHGGVPRRLADDDVGGSVR